MRYLLIMVALFIATPVFADVYVVTAQDKSIYSISERDDAVVPAGYSKDVIVGKSISGLAIEEDVSLYTYSNKKFSLNAQKVSKKNSDLQAEILLKEQKDSAKVSAVNKLKALGLTDDEIQSISGRE